MGILGDIFNFPISLENMRLQREQQNYDRNLQQQIFQREDTAVQRAAADLEAAGLSKTLAAGSGAGAGQLVSSRAPQMERVGNMDLAGAIQQMTQVAATGAQIDLIESQKRLVDEQRTGVGIKNQYDAATLEARTEQEKLAVTAARLANELKNKDSKHKDVQIARETLEKELREKYGYSYEEAKVKAAQVENRIKEYNEKWYKDMKLPISPGGSADLWTKAAGVLSSLGKDALEALVGGSVPEKWKVSPVDEPGNYEWIREILNSLLGQPTRAPVSGRSH